MDRFYHSSCVYQGMMATMSPQEIYYAHGPWAIKPDVTFILHLDPDESERRLQKRDQPLEKIALEKLEGDRGIRVEIQRRYRDLQRQRYPEFDECVLIDAIEAPEKVAENCMLSMQDIFYSWLNKRTG
jgi:thymidylate kinase